MTVLFMVACFSLVFVNDNFLCFSIAYNTCFNSCSCDCRISYFHIIATNE